MRGSATMSKSWAGVAHSQQGGSDTQRSPTSQETREAWCYHVYPAGAGAGHRITKWRTQKHEITSRIRSKKEKEHKGARRGAAAAAALDQQQEQKQEERKKLQRGGGGQQEQEEPQEQR